MTRQCLQLVGNGDAPRPHSVIGDQVDVCEDIAQRKESFDAHVGRLGLLSVLHIVSTMTALGSGGCRLCLPVRVLA